MATNPIKIPNYPKPSQVSKMNKGNKIWSPEGLNFHKATTAGGAFGAAQREKVKDLDVGKIIVGDIPYYKKGGKVKKTGQAIVHKGEMVIPKKVVKNKTYAQVAKSVRRTMGKI